MNKLFSWIKNLNIDFYLVTLLLLAIVGCIVFTGHYNGILIDFGREVYYPERILDGKILYKDLFNIYGPFSYLMNAFLYKCFGANLYTLYAAGTVLALTLTGFIYKIADLFLSKVQSFAIGFFAIAVGICTTVIFNFTFPYSWGMLYGTVFFAISLYYLLKSIDENNDCRNILYSSLFAGLAVANKYEFIPYALLIIFYIFKSRKNIPLALCSFFAPIAVSYGILFLQGLNFSELIDALSIVKTMSKTQTLKYFYLNHGIFFSVKAVLLDLIIFVPVFLTILFFFKANKTKKLPAHLCLFTGAFLTLILAQKVNHDTFIYLPLLLIFVFLWQIRKITDKKIFYLFTATILLSLKSIWALMIFGYGSYYVSFLLISLFTLINENWKKAIYLFLYCISAIFILQNYQNIPSTYINTERGKIYTNSSNVLSEVTNYFSSLPNTDRVLFLPEGMILNFLTHTKSDDFYNSFIPLYIETFSEKTLIEHYQQTKPEYIVFSNTDMRDYGYESICQDYALQFCSYVLNNYDLTEKFSENTNTFLIYKKK
ncbi:glycosyltransferase family 39 protein [bacterium]|nr:glycosyltransferase family 39 protein [bacterium]